MARRIRNQTKSEKVNEFLAKNFDKEITLYGHGKTAERFPLKFIIEDFEVNPDKTITIDGMNKRLGHFQTTIKPSDIAKMVTDESE